MAVQMTTKQAEELVRSLECDRHILLEYREILDEMARQCQLPTDPIAVHAIQSLGQQVGNALTWINEKQQKLLDCLFYVTRRKGGEVTNEVTNPDSLGCKLVDELGPKVSGHYFGSIVRVNHRTLDLVERYAAIRKVHVATLIAWAVDEYIEKHGWSKKEETDGRRPHPKGVGRTRRKGV